MLWLLSVCVRSLFSSLSSEDPFLYPLLLEVCGRLAVVSFGLIVILFLIRISDGLTIGIMPLLGVLWPGPFCVQVALKFGQAYLN